MDSSLANQTMVCKGNTAGDPDYIFHVTSSTELRFYDGTQWNISSGTTFVAGTWYHVVVTYDGSTFRFYVNGASNGTQARTVTIQTSTQNLRLGVQGSAGSNRLDGKLAEVAIWKGVQLSDNEILSLAKGAKPHMFRTSNLEMYMPLWGAGSPEADLSGKKNNGTLTGTTPAAHSPTGRYIKLI
jgi:hypothetical protein